LQALEVMLGLGADRPPPPPGMVEVVVDPSDHDVLRSDLIQAENVWERPPPAFILDLSEHGLDTRLLYEHQRSQQGAQVDHFGPVQVLGRDVVLAPGLTDDQRRFYCKNTRAKAALGSLGTAAQHSDIEDGSTAMVRDGDRFLYPRERLEGAEVLDAPVFLATPDEHLNWGMWLLYNVPTAVEYARYAAEYPHFLCAMGQGWQRPLLLELGVPEEALLQHRMDRVLSVPALATYRQTFRGMVLREKDASAFDAVGARLTAGESPNPARLYVSRKGMHHHRVLTNEDELEAALDARGFVSVQPERLPFREQVRLFRNAEAVVGLGGAGMFNVAFCRPGVRVVTIESSMLWVDSHVNLIASRGASYGVILGRQDPADPTPDHKRWWLDVPRAVSAIDDLLAA
jgi:capsular polysaccharide biosynthesis protein